MQASEFLLRTILRRLIGKHFSFYLDAALGSISDYKFSFLNSWRGPACQHLQRSNGGQVLRITLFFVVVVFPIPGLRLGEPMPRRDGIENNNPLSAEDVKLCPRHCGIFVLLQRYLCNTGRCFIIPYLLSFQRHPFYCHISETGHRSRHCPNYQFSSSKKFHCAFSEKVVSPQYHLPEVQGRRRREGR